ncbi:unnamed protein product [Phytophthora fragariaefolia]|uniref:Unnamed protein product n=1 Tax=Phytophthora fragariaefolia TaxID=1490495 RepID=A0A9W6U244_9STRA|nr:unnamed protein product [Phytophthora fragariaefolia]
MVVVVLTCALVGNAGVFGVKIDDSARVWELKDVIKEKNPATITCDAKDLKLSLAKTADGAWLPSNDPDVVAMRSGAVSEKVQNLLNGQIDPAEEISDVFVPAPQKKQIHVLVVVPYLEQAQVDMFHESLSLARQASVRQSRIEMRLEQLAASLPHKNSKSYTDGALGQLLLERLRKDGMLFDLPPTDDGEAFWSADI